MREWPELARGIGTWNAGAGRTKQAIILLHGDGPRRELLGDLNRQRLGFQKERDPRPRAAPNARVSGLIEGDCRGRNDVAAVIARSPMAPFTRSAI